MSLLLDALKSTEVDAAAPIDLPSDVPQEEPLDARATLQLLMPASLEVDARSTVNDSIALEPSSDVASAQAGVPHSVADAAPAVSLHIRPSPALTGTTAEPTATRKDAAALGMRIQGETAAPGTNAGGTATAPSPAPSTTPSPAHSSKQYRFLIAAIVAAMGIGVIGKLLWPKTNALSHPEGEQSQPVAAADPGPAPVSLQSVKVPSARPADRFAYAGTAPEIDLHDTESQRFAARKPVSSSSETSLSAGAPPVTAATLSVAVSSQQSSIDRHVQAGYLALAAGNVASAQQEYLAALESDANNVDALLGAATAAARDGKPQVASAAYAKVLRLEPGNPDATAAMAMLKSDGTASESNESRLKILIAGGDGNGPALHTALAGVYAGDARWTEAAQEYFTALGKDPGNPDLAFDVAASLDQNRNTRMALHFYQQALEFARQRPAQFDPHAVERRIGQLQAHVVSTQASAPELR